MRIKGLTIDFKESDIPELVRKGYLVTFRTMYRIKETDAGFMAVKVYSKKGGVPLIPRGRFMIVTEDHANRLSDGLMRKEA